MNQSKIWFTRLQPSLLSMNKLTASMVGVGIVPVTIGFYNVEEIKNF